MKLGFGKIVIAWALGAGLAGAPVVAQDAWSGGSYSPAGGYQSQSNYSQSGTPSSQTVAPQSSSFASPQAAPYAQSGTLYPQGGSYQPAGEEPQDRRIAQLETELTSLKERLSAPAGHFDPALGGAPCGHHLGPCCVPCQRGGFYAGFELVWLRPHFRGNQAFVIDPPPNDNLGVAFNYRHQVTPRVWIGYTDAETGWGARARYWQFDHMASRVSGVIPDDAPFGFAEVSFTPLVNRNAFAGPGETMSASHKLELQTLDFEATRQLSWQRSLVLAGLGMRYLRMDQEFGAIATTAAGDLDEILMHRHGFEGIGPTFSLELVQPLGLGIDGLSFYGNVRGSVLFGNTYQNVFLEKRTEFIDASGSDFRRATEALAIAEAQVGLEYSRLVSDNALAFVRGGYEVQYWFDAGSPLRTTGNMALEGFALGFGLRY